MSHDDFDDKKQGSLLDKVGPEKKKFKLPKIKRFSIKSPKLVKHWMKIVIIVVSVLFVAYVASVVTAGIGIYKYRWQNKFSNFEKPLGWQ